MKNIALRADASVRTGTGHLRRCLSLAHALIACGAHPYFISRRLDGTAATILRDTPFEVLWLPEVVINEPIEASHCGSQCGWFPWSGAMSFLSAVLPHQPSHAGPHSGLSRS